MRKIKFRIWNNEEKMMIYPKENEYSDYFITIDGDVYSMDFDCPDGGFTYEDNNAKLMQFTGLLDKNGKEIYDGDIVKFSSYWIGDYVEKETIKEIKYDIYGFNEKIEIGYAGKPDWCEVIGNIYENPNLLN